MKVRLEHNWPGMEWKVWIVEGVGENRAGRVLRFDPLGAPRWEAIEEGTFPEPTLRLPDDAIEALVSAALDEQGVVKPSTEQGEALRDARAVRDRLLTMVEALTLPPPRPEN